MAYFTRVFVLLGSAATFLACAPRPAALAPAVPASVPADTFLEYEEAEYDFATAAPLPPHRVL